MARKEDWERKADARDRMIGEMQERFGFRFKPTGLFTDAWCLTLPQKGSHLKLKEIKAALEELGWEGSNGYSYRSYSGYRWYEKETRAEIQLLSRKYSRYGDRLCGVRIQWL